MIVAPNTHIYPEGTEERIAELAVAALREPADPTGYAALGDHLLETGWRDTRVMMLCLGVPLESRPPARLGEWGKSTWRSQREESIAFADSNWDLYAGSTRADFARAVLATLLFGSWRPASPYRNGTRSPWPLVRAHMLAVSRR